MKAGILPATTLVALAFVAAPAAAQDVELLGLVHGTRPPDAYYRVRAENPDAFRFARGWKTRIGAPLLVDSDGAAGAGPSGTPLGERPGGVSGTLAFPLVLGLYADSPETAPYARDVVQRHFFDGPNPNGTIPDYYAEQSGGLLDLVGVTLDWQRSSRTALEVSGGVGGLSTPGQVGAFITELLTALDDGSIDWGQFDNDGLDGVPNSGDDDGFVDVLAVMHPTAGAECDGNRDRVWSHRWSLRFAAGQSYRTKTASSSTLPGAPTAIVIDDYTIQPAKSCLPTDVINEIGVFAHELGHGLGLPDLYDTNGNDGVHGAAGRWDVMATGAWGCRGGNPARPCHMGAWSKSVLGWVDVGTLAPGQDHGVLTLTPVEVDRRVYRIDSGDGANEYFLLENRNRTGFDQQLFGDGLLIWHVDQDVLDQRWAANNVNADPTHMAVWVRAGDGLDEAALSGNDRGDAGDLFPGATDNRVFHAGSNPGSWSHDGGAAGLTVLDIEMQGDDVSFRALTRYQTLSIEAGGTDGNPALVSVDGGAPTPTDITLSSAPFQSHTIEAGAGSAVGEGVRAGFLAWEDGTPRIRQFTTGLSDSTLVATYGGDLEMRLSVTLVSAAEGIDPGQLEAFPSSPDGWYDVGTEVSLTAVPRTGFAFREWAGDLAGSPNPVSVVMDAPVTATAEYDVTFGTTATPARVELEGAVDAAVVLEAENANLPVQWALLTGRIPDGLLLRADGRLAGVPMEAGTFELTLRARDAIGLEATAALTLEIAPPSVGTQALTAPFLGAGVGPTLSQRDYLDRNGNTNGVYDLGDFRAFLLDNPGLPPTAPVTLAPSSSRVVLPLEFRRGGKPR
jgi:M6 family metalloprotease-like protein